jgi:hypothetical protein
MQLLACPAPSRPQSLCAYSTLPSRRLVSNATAVHPLAAETPTPFLLFQSHSLESGRNAAWSQLRVWPAMCQGENTSKSLHFLGQLGGSVLRNLVDKATFHFYC